ncbi:TolC family protein [Candidatus Fermentibacteria bacterium]|nr:TolC family protein [Candidatus Fermentibacteria bacterium]
MKAAAAVLLAVQAAFSITLEEAVSIALSSRGDVGAAWSGYESASWQRRSAGLWFLPRVSASGSLVRNHDIQEMEIPGMGSFPVGSEYSSSVGLTAAVPLFTASGIAGAGLARSAETLAMYNAIASEQDAVLQVASAFYGVLLAEELSDVAREALDIAEQGYALAEQRYAAGTISRFELLQSRVAYETRIPEAISAAFGVENAKSSLAVALGLPDSTGLDPEGSLDDPVPVAADVGSIEEAREVMLARSPDLAVADGMREVGAGGLRLAAASFAPTVMFQASYGFLAQGDDWRFDPEDYDRSWTSMISVQIPIFDGLSDVAGYNSARSDMLSSAWRARSLEQYCGLRLTEACNALEEARRMVEATASTVSQAEEGAEIASVSYEAGVITRLDMDQAFLALTAARTNHASALYSLRMAEAGLARAMGVLALEQRGEDE